MCPVEVQEESHAEEAAGGAEAGGGGGPSVGQTQGQPPQGAQHLHPQFSRDGEEWRLLQSPERLPRTHEDSQERGSQSGHLH